MLVGLDRLPSLAPLVSRLRSAPFGLLAHAPSVDRNLLHISDVLERLDLRAARIFGPEHGYGGEAQDMVGVAGAVDPRSGAPIVSLYGDRFDDLSPRASDLDGLRTLLIDLCDVGSRYYTFVWTAWLAVRAAAAAGIHCVILDRPNPIGGTSSPCEGRPQLQRYLSFVGLEPIPVRHGLTAGELVAHVARLHGLGLGPDEALELVGVEGWDRSLLASDWDRPFVMPSPNMPTLETALVYPGGCLLEGTNLSEGRGTTRPFEIFGAPWLDGRALAKALHGAGLEGFVARPITFAPTFHKHAGQICGGVQVHVTHPDRFRPVAVYTAAIALACRQAPEHFRFRTERYEFVDDIPAIDLLFGNGEVRRAMLEQRPLLEILLLACGVPATWADDHAAAVSLPRT